MTTARSKTGRGVSAEVFVDGPCHCDDVIILVAGAPAYAGRDACMTCPATSLSGRRIVMSTLTCIKQYAKNLQVHQLLAQPAATRCYYAILDQLQMSV